MRSISAKANLAVQRLIEQVLATGQLTRRQYLQLSSSLLSERSMTHLERSQISRIFDEVQMGRFKLID